MPPHGLSPRGRGLEARRPGPCPGVVGGGWAGAAPRRLSGEPQPAGRVPGVGARRPRCGGRPSVSLKAPSWMPPFLGGDSG